MIITNSAIKKFQQCPRAYYWRYEKQLVSTKTNDALQIGKYFHKGRELFDLGWKPDYCLEECDRLYFKEDGKLSQKGIDELYKMKYIGSALLTLSFSIWPRYKDADFEKVFSCEMFGVTLMGKIDIDDSKNNKLCDYKTTGRLNNAYIAQLPIDNQPLFYSTIYGQLQNVDIDTFTYYIVKKPTIKRKQDESLEDYIERVKQNIEEGKCEFHIEEVEITPKRKEEFLEGLQNNVENIRACVRQSDYVQHTGNCFQYGECDYFKICKEGFENVSEFYKHEEANIELKEGE